MDKEQKKLLKEISAKRDLEVNLPKYATFMADKTLGYGTIRVALNYYTITEIVSEEKDTMDEYCLAKIKDIDDIVLRYFINKEFDGDIREKDIKNVDAIRNAIIAKMKVLTAYTDTLQIYENVLNKVEGSVLEKEEQDVDIDSFGSEIFRYIFSDEDKVVINSKLQMITSQLPVRMTKAKFYDILNQSLAIYANSDKESLDDFVDMIRTTANIEKPEGYYEEYPAIADFIKTLESTDYKALDKDTYNTLSLKLNQIAEEINDIVTNYIQLVEIINDLYVILLAVPYSMEADKDIITATKIIAGVYKSHIEDKDIPEEIDELLVSLEGVQEELYQDILSGDSLLYDIQMEHKDIIASTMGECVFNALYTIDKLLSNSLFIDLNRDVGEGEMVDSTYLNKVKDTLVSEFTKLFADSSKDIYRAIMAIVLGELPVFFNSQQEINDYIYYSLNHCNNQSELMSAYAVINDIMRE